HHDCRDRHSERVYICQKRETVFDFFQRLAAEEGISFWFDNANGLERCVYSDSRLSLRGGLTLSYNDHPQNRMEGDYVQAITLAVTMTPQQVIGKYYRYQQPDYPFKHQVSQATVNTDS